MVNGATQPPRYAAKLMLLMVLIAGINGLLWVTGFKDRELREAVEQGAARAEQRAVGESDEEEISETVRTQRDTLPFWTALYLLGDFVFQPLILALRALAAATVFSAAAALFGRRVRFETAMADCVACQWIWVFEAAVGAGLTVLLRKPDVDTSLALLVPPGEYSAATWVVLRQLGLLAIFGWFTMAWQARQREEMSLPVALTVCGFLALVEVTLTSAAVLVVGGQMRLALTQG